MTGKRRRNNFSQLHQWHLQIFREFSMCGTSSMVQSLLRLEISNSKLEHLACLTTSDIWIVFVKLNQNLEYKY